MEKNMNNADICEEVVVSAEQNNEGRILKWLTIIFGAESIILAIIATFAVCKMVYMQTEINYLENRLSEAHERISSIYPAEAENGIGVLLQLDELM